jgi:uncharacterized LabA/DUF88 family protein
MTRVITYIDGFNLYHAIHDLREPALKWVDLWALSENIIRDYQTLEAVKYFSAYATWRPGPFQRHRAYVAALEARGVQAIMGRFKEKTVRCQATCREEFTTHEEKETDVNIGVHLLTDTLRDRFDTALVISADTDLNVAVKMARSEAPNKCIELVSPPGRFNRNREVPPLFAITKGKLRSSLLPDEIVTASGATIRRPERYR